MTPKGEPVREDDDDYGDEFLEEDALTFVRENVGPVTSPYIMPYVNKLRFLDTNAVYERTVIYLRLAIPQC